MSRTSDANAAGWLLGEWCTRLSRAVESMTGEAPALASNPAAPDAPGAANPDSLWWRQPFSADVSAPVWAGAPRECWKQLGALTLQSAGIEQPEETDARTTYLEILSQSFSGLARSIGGRLGREVNCQDGAEVSEPPRCPLFEVTLTFASGALAPLLVGFDPGLLLQIGAGSSPQPPAAQPVARLQQPEPLPRANSRTLELLMEVELPVSVSFGRAHMPLKDVLKLTSGSIVELDRTVAEPVEVIVNNRVIARGEVVVVEGNYGVRIQEIISRQDRMRTLK